MPKATVSSIVTRPRIALVFTALLLSSGVAFADTPSNDSRVRALDEGASQPPPRANTLFFKQVYPDYAPSGMPDFSQDHMGFDPTLCGPAAVSNCLWWFDSKFEGGCPGGGPGDGVDDVPLVEALPPAVDDHDFINPPPLMLDLAARMGTHPLTGTTLTQMEIELNQWLIDHGLFSSFVVKVFHHPTFEQIGCMIKRSEDAILLLGLYWLDSNTGLWHRCGGHYVTVAGLNFTQDVGPDGQPGDAFLDDDGDEAFDEPDEICPCAPNGLIPTDDLCGLTQREIYISDPGRNNAEAGGAGLVQGPAHGNHAPSPLPPPDHDDPLNASHDLYGIGFGVAEPLSLFGYGGEQGDCSVIQRWCGQNPNPVSDLPEGECEDSRVLDVSVEIEAMVTISPVTCEICIDVASTAPTRIELHKNPCPSPSSIFPHFNYIRGELCQLSESAGQVDLGAVQCLVGDTPAGQYEERTTPVYNGGIGASFFLVGQYTLPGPLPPTDYGFSSTPNPRFPSSGNCP